jgi:hypothetical protein
LKASGRVVGAVGVVQERFRTNRRVDRVVFGRDEEVAKERFVSDGRVAVANVVIERFVSDGRVTAATYV